jgi:hypothetical protein
MIQECPECKGKVSDQAASCPHCGHPLNAQAPEVTQPKARPAPVFMVLAFLGLIASLFTPRLIVALPIFATMAFAAISLFRRERPRLLSGLALVGAAGLLLLSGSTSSQLSGEDPSALKAVEIVSWNWRRDPSFGTKGTIRWNAQVRNLSNRYIESVRLELTTYDSGGKLVTTAFTFVRAIPPGETRSDESHADYYGTEQRATLQVARVRFSTP